MSILVPKNQSLPMSDFADPEDFQKELKLRLQKNVERFLAWLEQNGKNPKDFARLTGMSYPRVLRHTKGDSMPEDVLTAVIMMDPKLSLRWLMGLDDIDQDREYLAYTPIEPKASTPEVYREQLHEANKMIIALQKRLLDFKMASLQINEEEMRALQIGKNLLASPEGKTIIEEQHLDTYHPDTPKKKRD